MLLLQLLPHISLASTSASSFHALKIFDLLLLGWRFELSPKGESGSTNEKLP